MFFQNLTRKNEIGANCYLLDLDGTRVMLDSGMDPKAEGLEALPDFSDLEYDSLDAVCISHAHLDHVGALPVLMREQPSAPVYMTEATAALADAMLHNSVNVMTAQREEHGITEYPLFTHREVDYLERHWLPRSLGRRFEIGDNGIVGEFFDAGHIPGSTGIRLTAGERTVFYTGDVNFEDQTIMRAASFPEEPVDTLIVETTRGAASRAPHYDRRHEERRLADGIRETIARGGSVLIPVFAMGKTQELLVMLHRCKQQGLLPSSIPVFIGGLSTKMTVIIDRFASTIPRNFEGLEILKQIDVQVASRRRSRELFYSPGCIYALSSGMMTEKTVSNQFALKFLDNPRNALFFVGYADPESPGGRIRSASPGDPVMLDPDSPPVELRCKVDVFDFSGHAPREDIRRFIGRVRPRQVMLVHGDADALEWFAAGIRADLPETEVIIPEPGRRYPLAGGPGGSEPATAP